MSLNERQKQLKRQIIKHTNSIKQKLSNLKKFDEQHLQFTTDTFKPITQPLDKLVSTVENNLKTPKSFVSNETQTATSPITHRQQQTQEYQDMEGATSSVSHQLLTPASSPIHEIQSFSIPTVDDYLQPLINSKYKKRGYDKVYGPKYNNYKIMLANTELVFDSLNNTLTVNNTKFDVTPGLLELIFKSRPQRYNTHDLKIYKEVLKITNAHRLNAEHTSPIKTSTLYKYKNIISKLFNDKNLAKTGKGLYDWKDVHINHNIDYKYWSDPNILVDRLRLLVASCNAGNNAHNNEIQEIITELKSKKYIL